MRSYPRQLEFVEMLKAGITMGQAVARTGYSEHFIKSLLRDHQDWPRLLPSTVEGVRDYIASGDQSFSANPANHNRRRVSLKAEPWHVR